MKYESGLYHFILIKGIMEILIAFVFLYLVLVKPESSILVVIFILIVFGILDLKEFIKRRRIKTSGERR